MTTFLHQLELRSHADYAETIPTDMYPMGVIALLSLKWEGDGKEQSMVYFDTHGRPTSFDVLSGEDKEKRLDVGKSIKILKQDDKEVAHLTSVRTDDSDNTYIGDFLVPRSVFSDPELIVVGENQEELEANVVFIRALLQVYLEYYSSLPKAEFVPREVKKYAPDIPVEADGEVHPLFDVDKFNLTKKLSMAAD